MPILLRAAGMYAIKETVTSINTQTGQSQVPATVINIALLLSCNNSDSACVVFAHVCMLN